MGGREATHTSQPLLLERGYGYAEIPAWPSSDSTTYCTPAVSLTCLANMSGSIIKGCFFDAFLVRFNEDPQFQKERCLNPDPKTVSLLLEKWRRSE